MTDAQLQGLAAQACNLAKLDMERGKFHFLLASYHNGEQLHRMTSVENLIVEKLGEDWLNHDRTKDVGFHMLRLCVDLMPPDAFIFASATNRFRTTKRFDQLPREEQKAILDAGYERHHEDVKKGLFTMTDSLTVLVQTPERACFYWQDYDCYGEPMGKPETSFAAQDGFGGRLKMFGEDKTHAASR